MRAIGLACCLAVWAAPVLAQTPSIEKLSWLAGCWTRETKNGLIEEQWMKPRGGMMIGMSRTVRAGKVVDYESMQILKRAGTLVYAAQPSGQPAAEFVARTLDGPAARFENAAHDFPQRIIYQPGTADSLFARIEGTMKGKFSGVDFRMKRSSCSD